jgi:hypothetical protein
VLWYDKVVIFSVDEKSWNVSLFDVVTDRIQVLNIELVLR